MKAKTKLILRSHSNFLEWLNKKGIKITIKHEYFIEDYQNKETFENNYKNFKQTIY